MTAAITLQPTRRYTPDEVWAAEFEPEIRARLQRITDARAEAFLDVPMPLCGELVRQLTPRDMLYLDAIENPFVHGSSDGTLHFIDIAGFIWELHVENDHTPSLRNLWRRRAVVKRLEQLPLEASAREIVAFVDRMLPGKQSAPPDENASTVLRREPSTYFLAPLLANLAADMGHIDPMSGQLLSQTPLPRLLQYAQAILEEKQPAAREDETAGERARCVERTNQLNWEYTHAPKS